MTWQERAVNCIAGGCLTFSKSARYYVKGQPTHVYGSDGIYLDTNEGRVLDTVSGLGSNLIQCNNNYSLPSIYEVILAERLIERLAIPSLDRVKLVKTGSEACAAAVRYARAATGRQEVIGLGYHGWANDFISAESPGLGCTPCPYVKKQELKGIAESVSTATAAVIIEPWILDRYVTPLLQKLRDACTQHGALLIYDEVITGFRVLWATVGKFTGVIPDMIVMGKALGNGYPLGVVLGNHNVMDIEGVFVSGTFAGELTGITGALTVLNLVDDRCLDRFWQSANDFQVKFNKIWQGRLRLEGYGTRGVIKGDATDVAQHAQMMMSQGVLIGPAWFPKVTWTQETYDTILTATRYVRAYFDSYQFRGPLPRPVFART